jgi:hypothetical protein
MPQSGTIIAALFSPTGGAAGSWELSKSSTSQIATGSPDVGVICRLRLAAVATPAIFVVLGISVKVLDNWYIHTTGAGNVGELTLFIG